MTTTVVPDARRWMAFHSIGSYELLLHVHGHLEDYLGALGAGQPWVATSAARSLVLGCLAVRALAVDGVPSTPDDPFADPFAGLPEELVADGLSLLRGVVDGSTRQQDVVRYVRALERDLGFDTPPPSIRRPQGLYPALRMARELIPLNRASGFPLALPSSWLAAEDQEG